jgi:DMSO/TMAO reductase YedYZ molybdopterin-dependent catalytic subunit
VLKPQYLIASRRSDHRLPQVYGAPLRLRVENQLGYKMVKWIERIELIDSEKLLGKGDGGNGQLGIGGLPRNLAESVIQVLQHGQAAKTPPPACPPSKTDSIPI